MRVVDKIDSIRVYREITKDRLEKEAGLSAGRICKWLAGQGSPNTDQLVSIAKVLGISPSDLLFDKSDAYIEGYGMRIEDIQTIVDIAEDLGFEEVMRRLIAPAILMPSCCSVSISIKKDERRRSA